MTPADRSEPIRVFFKDLGERYTIERDQDHAAETPTHGDRLVDELVRALLQWEASHSQARAAYQRLLSSVIDYTELRICFPADVAKVLGPRYPRVEERCERLRCALNDIAAREQSLSLARLGEMNKRDAKQYVESIEGLPKFVAARVVLFGLGGHAFPLDDRLLDHLIGAELFEPDTDVDSAAAKIERALRAGEAADGYDLLELWSANGGAGKKPRPRTTKKKAPSKQSSSAAS
ncbi:MAG: hypothetical protein AAGI17_04835 [Planctomycetota bacterium]